MATDYVFSEWTQIKATVKLPMLDRLTAIMTVIDVNLMIEDYSDVDLAGVYGDLIDESILNADKGIASVSVFLPAEDKERVRGTLAFLRERLSLEAIEADVTEQNLNEADWVNNWKRYYKPLRAGKRVVIVPKWEKHSPADGEIIVTMDPGMAFGTGSHETTSLVIGMLEERVRKGCSVLDVGCGSGILAICAKKLGAGQCYAYDIDPIAVEVAAENAKFNGCDVTCERSDLLRDVRHGKYDVICANIVADIIIRMSTDIVDFMHDDTTLLASGIISERADEVKEALMKAGLVVDEVREKNGWCAMAVKKP